VRSARFILPLTLAVALGACGSTKAQVAGPTVPKAPAKLSIAPAAGRVGTAIYPQRPTTYVLDGTLADLGTTAPVRKLVAHDVSAADLARIAAALGMHGTPQPTATGYELRAGDATLTVDTSGATTMIDYATGVATAVSGGGSGSTNGSSIPPSAKTDPATPAPVPLPPPEPVPLPLPTIPPPVDVPSAADATDIAQTLLDNLGVLDGRQWSHSVLNADAVVSSCPPGADCPTQAPSPIYSRMVTYQLVVDGVAVPGVNWSITIGEHKRVEYLSGSWVRAQDPVSYPLRSTANVFDDLQHDRAHYAGPQPMLAQGAPEIAPHNALTLPETAPALEVHITGVSLGVARTDGTENGKAVAYLVPTYRFHAAVAHGAPYDIEVIALDPPSFTITPDPGAVPQPLAGKEVQK
jgi:hypothetical protein